MSDMGDGVAAVRDALDDPRAVLLPAKFRLAFALLLRDIGELARRVERLEGGVKNDR